MKKNIALTCVLFFVVSLSILYKKFVVDYSRLHLHDTPVSLIIPTHASAKKISDLLEAKGVIKSQTLFYWSVRLRKLERKLRSGEYHFPEHRSLKTVIEKLVAGDVVYHRLTIAEGLTSKEILALIKADSKLEGDLVDPIPEGTLLPETYTFLRGSTRQNLVQEMASSLEKSLADLWENRAPNLPLKTPQEALVLASIVEKETALAKERPHIAAVFVNRLRKGMPLQTDPTVIYAIELLTGQELGRPLLKKDLDIDSPFNTYRHVGLPPAPICHVGLAALKAVLNPMESDDLFFVADGTGGHVFAKTYKEHAKNHVKWRKIRKTLK